MYLIEWRMWCHNESSSEDRNIIEDIWQEAGISRFEQYLITQTVVNHNKEYSKTPRPLGPYYAYNDRYLDIRGGMMEERRGIISLLTLAWLGAGMCNLFFLIMILNDSYVRIRALGVLDYAAIVFSFFLAAILLVPFFIGGYKISRLEIFTYRHLRVRFNRITRQVYVQRPKFCGGTAVYRWEDTNIGLAKDGKVSHAGSPNLLIWESINTGLPYNDYMAIGKQASTTRDAYDEWEFIRRYMEHGPEGLPKPRLASLLPLPWHGASVQLEAMRNFFLPLDRFSLLTLPLGCCAVTLMSVLYFLSELFCWQPRWPKIIREAGCDGKPVPKLTSLADFPTAIQERLLLNLEEIEYIDEPEPAKKRDNPRKFYKKKYKKVRTPSST